jgi:hypothetical protein
MVDSEYEGEPLATFHAELATAPPSGTPPLDVAMWWTGVERGVLQRVAVSGDFPSTVMLQVTQPPPDDVLLGTESSAPWGMKFGCEPLVVVDRSTQELEPGATLGVTENHVVCYLEKAVVAGTPLATILGGTYSAGFHVLRIEHRQTRYEAEMSGTLPAYEADLAQCRSDWAALHGSSPDAVYFCTRDRAYPTPGDQATVMPLTLGDVVYPNFRLDT